VDFVFWLDLWLKFLSTCLEPVGFGGVLLSIHLHVFFFIFLGLHHLLNVHVQLAHKIGLKKCVPWFNIFARLITIFSAYFPVISYQVSGVYTAVVTITWVVHY
jgi:hypothetical protein